MLAVVAGLVALTLPGPPPRDIADPSLLHVFVAAAVAICALILPGVSGPLPASTATRLATASGRRCFGGNPPGPPYQHTCEGLSVR